jgi:hypothetical protein
LGSLYSHILTHAHKHKHTYKLPYLKHTGDVLLRHDTTLDFTLEGEPAAGLSGLKAEGNIGKLARATGLFLVHVSDLCSKRNLWVGECMMYVRLWTTEKKEHSKYDE